MEAHVKYPWFMAILGALAFGGSPAHAQLIGGEVNDELTGVPLVDFTVFLHRFVGDSSFIVDSAVKDRRGFFQMAARAPGRYQLAFGRDSALLARGPIDTLATDTTMSARRYLVPISRISRTTGFLEHQVQKPALALTGCKCPNYPTDLRARRMQGRVTATFVVDTAGRAEPATFRALESSDIAFTEAVREALPKMRFVPATVAGIKVRMWVEQAFEFRMGQH